MISRFQGEGGQARLIAVLRAQRTISDEETLAKEIAKIACLIQLEPNTPTSEFIKQGATDNDIYLILEGKVSIRVNGREVAVRVSGYHVGEMALIDPTARRSASVVAVEQTVLAKVSEASFASLANQFPQLWRRLALDLAERLRHRGRFVSSPNPQPVLFVGSSVERHPVASEIQSGLRNDRMIVIVWADDVFRASKSSVESLLATVLSSDFAVLLIAPDDIVMSRDIESPAPRDNVVLELGLLMGLLGRERTFIVRPRGANIKLPSDWLDFKPLEYAEGTPDTLESRVAPICNEIRKAIQKLGPI
jgi:predicted nucleotide-binding protein